MKNILICFVAFFLSVSGYAQEKIHLSVNPEIRYQTIDGFGASDAWRCQFVGKNWPLEKREKMADWLFSTDVDIHGNPKGIGLSIWRFYLAAGTTEQGDSSGIANPWRRGESFLSPDGSWNWSKYEGQRWFLKAAKDRGVPKFLAFTIAPPVQFANSGKGFATKGDTHFNVKPGKTDDYAQYLGEVLSHFKKSEGIEFNYISPINEPQWNWEQGNQEGTPASNEEMYVFIKYLSGELTRRGLQTLIVPGEAATIDYVSSFVNNDGRDNQMETYFSKSSQLYIGSIPNIAPIISAHSYFTVWPLNTQIDSRKKLAAKMKSVDPGIGYWQSEYSILEKNDEVGQGSGRDLGMATALFVSRIIHNDLTICNARSWQWWTALTIWDYKDGLIYLDSGTDEQVGKMGPEAESLQFDGTPRDSKLMWVLGNYSRFVRPGMIRVEAKLSDEGTSSVKSGEVMASAYLDQNTNRLIVVVVNTKYTAQEVSHSIQTKNNQINLYVTSERMNLSFQISKDKNIVIPSRSVATLCFELK